MAGIHDAPNLGDAAERLAALLGPRDTVRLDAQPLPAARPPPCVAAVDGSSAVLADARAFLIGACRAAVVRVEDGRPAGEDVDPPRVLLIERGTVARPVRESLAALGATRVEADDRAAPEVTLGHVRALAEWAAARRALDRLAAGDVLLLDGPLRIREPDAPRVVVEPLVDSAVARGVGLAAVSKSTSQTIGGFPALALAARAAGTRGLATFLAELPRADRASPARSFAVRLSAADHRVFRVDVPATEPDPGSVLARLGALAGHPAYPGYPSPLAMAHHACVIDEGMQRDLTMTVRRRAEDAGADPELWDLAFEDYHDVLDRGA